MFLTDLTENELHIVIDKLIEKYVKEYMRNPLNVQNVSKLHREYKEEQKERQLHNLEDTSIKDFTFEDWFKYKVEKAVTDSILR